MLRRKGILVVLATLATLVFGVSVASAARSFNTHIVYLGINGPSPSLQDQTLFGDLNARHGCRSARLMELFKKTSRGYRLLDVDLSSFNGAWALRADLRGTPDLAIRAKREKRNHGRVVCRADTFLLSADSPAYPRSQ